MTASENSNAPEGAAKAPRVRVVYKPIKPIDENTTKPDAAKPNASPYLRAENEDDDGYDPYSDRREEAPLFEPNPWD